MKEKVVVTGIVLSVMSVGEYDKRIVLLTRERGRITAFAKGGKKPNSPYASIRPFCFGQYELYEGRTAYNIMGASISNYFNELSIDLNGAYYGFYFLEFASYYTRENNDEKYMIQLLYQSLRALSKESLSNELIKCIFELKSIVINGEYPDMFNCLECGTQDNITYFSPSRAGVVCEHCKNIFSDRLAVSGTTVYTMQYVISAGIDKLYTFTVSDQVLNEFKNIMMKYKNIYIDKQFKSLEMIDMLYSQGLV